MAGGVAVMLVRELVEVEGPVTVGETRVVTTDIKQITMITICKLFYTPSFK